MANPKIEVEISSDVEKLRAGFSDAQASIVAFGNKIKELKAKFDSSNGVIGTLQNRISQLKKNLEGATDVRSIAQYNIRLKTAQDELARLGQVGLVTQSKLANANQNTSRSFGGLTKSVGNANGVAQEFSRIIQDAPFGIIGIGNNIQQLTANFATLRNQSTSTGAALKTALGALISPANLLVLGISAVTAAFTAYQMGAFDFLKSNEAAKKSIKELADEIDNAQSRSISEQTNINSLRAVIEDETLARDQRLKAIERLQDTYPEIFGNADKENLLNGKLIGSYDLLTKSIIQRAEASLAEDRIPKLNREKQVVDSQIKSLEKQLLVESELNKTRSSFVPQGSIFSEKNIGLAKVSDIDKKISELTTKSRGLQINIEGFTQSIVSYQEEFVNLLEPVNTGMGKVDEKTKEADESVKELIKTLGVFEQARFNINVDKLIGDQKPILDDYSAGFVPTQETAQVVDPTENLNRISELRSKLEEETPIVQTLVSQLGDAFSSLGGQIANSLNIGNDALKGFVSTLLSSTPKIIQAIFQQVAAKKAASLASQVASQGEAAGNAIASATSAASALGPLGLALLPVFIGGALALVSQAFGKGGGGGSGGGSVGAGVSGQSFTGGGVGGLGGGSRELTGELVVRGNDLVYVLGQSMNKITKG